MNKTAKELLKLGYEQPELRPHLRPILDELTKKASSDYDSPLEILDALGWPSIEPTLLQNIVGHVVWHMQKETSGRPEKIVVKLPDPKKLADMLHQTYSVQLVEFLVTFYPGFKDLPKEAQKLLRDHFSAVEKELQEEISENRFLSRSYTRLKKSLEDGGLDESEAWDLAEIFNEQDDWGQWSMDRILNPDNRGEVEDLMEFLADISQGAEKKLQELKASSYEDKLKAFVSDFKRGKALKEIVSTKLDKAYQTMLDQMHYLIYRSASELDISVRPYGVSKGNKFEVFVNDDRILTLGWGALAEFYSEVLRSLV